MSAQRVFSTILFSLLFCSALTGGETLADAYPQGSDRRKPDLDSIDSYIKAEIKKRRIAGLSAAIIDNGKVVMAKGYGMANVEQKAPASPDTMYQIASLTKPFTATAVMMLVEEGKISLDEKAWRYLEWLPPFYRDITVRQLLTHTSGVNRDLRRDNLDAFTEEEFRKRLANSPVSFKPGERWQYSNTGYILLGMIIEAASGKPYGEFLSERIFKPLGMNNTRYYDPPGSNRNRAIGYEWREKAFIQSPYFPGGFAAGGLVSTVSDISKWEIALSSEKLLKRSSLEQILKPARLGNGEEASFRFDEEPASYGFGWFLTRYKGHKLVTHGGAVSGFSSVINRFTDSKITIILLLNTKMSGVDKIVQGISNLALSK